MQAHTLIDLSQVENTGQTFNLLGSILDGYMSTCDWSCMCSYLIVQYLAPFNASLGTPAHQFLAGPAAAVLFTIAIATGIAIAIGIGIACMVVVYCTHVSYGCYVV